MVLSTYSVLCPQPLYEVRVADAVPSREGLHESLNLLRFSRQAEVGLVATKSYVHRHSGQIQLRNEASGNNNIWK